MQKLLRYLYTSPFIKRLFDLFFASFLICSLPKTWYVFYTQGGIWSILCTIQVSALLICIKGYFKR